MCCVLHAFTLHQTPSHALLLCSCNCYMTICFTSISYVFACAIEDSSLSEEWLTVTGETIMSRRLPSLCVSAGGTTRPLDAAVEQADIHTRTHTHTHIHTHTRAHTHAQASGKQSKTIYCSACQHIAGCFSPLSFISLCCR